MFICDNEKATMIEREWLSSTDPEAMLRYLTDWLVVKLPYPTGASTYIASARKLRLFAAGCCRQVWHLLTDDAPCPRRTCHGGAIATNAYGWRRCTDCKGTGRINRSRRAVEVAEKFADGEATAAECQDANYAACGVDLGQSQPASSLAAWCSSGAIANWAGSSAIEKYVTSSTQAALLREICGNPWRRMSICGRPRGIGRAFGMCSQTGGEEGVRPDFCPDCGPILRWNDGAVPRLAREIYDERRWEDLPVLADALEEAGCDNEEILRHCRGFSRHQIRLDDGVLRETWLPDSVAHVRGCWVLDLLLGKG